MLPSRGRGRAKNRNAGQGCKPGRSQSVQEPAESRDMPRCSRRTADGHTQFQKTNGSLNSEEGSHSSENSAEQSQQVNRVVSKSRPIDPEEIGIQFKRKMAIVPTLPARPDFGRLGKRIKLVSNCFPIDVPSGYVYHYDVSITKKQRNSESDESNARLLPAGANNDNKYRCLSTKRNREIIKLMLQTHPLFNNSYAAFDGQYNLYTRNPLRTNFPIKYEVILPNENNPNSPQQDSFEVRIKPAVQKGNGSCAINLDSLHAFFNKITSSVPQETVMALETILRHGPCLRLTPIGRSFFSPPSPTNMHPLGGGLEIWFGYHQSIRLGQWGPMVNLDVTATTFHQKGPLIKYIADCLHTTERELRRKPYLPNIDIKRISNRLKNMRVEVTHLRNYRRKYRILKLDKRAANRLEFDITVDGRTVRKTVAAYFRERYNKILEYPNLPCLQVYPENKNTYLPIEVCEIIEGQHSKMKLEPRQKAEMIKYTSRSPKERFSTIERIANTECNNDYVRHFNLEVSRKPLSLEGRVLDSPNVQYKDGEKVKPKDGSWNMRSSQFLSGAIVNSWVLLSFANLDLSVLKNFSNLLVKIGKETGMTIDYPKYTNNIDISRWNIKDLLLNMKEKYKADLVVIVLPTNDKYVYGRIKQVAETIIGLATQCIKEINVSDPKKCNAALIGNLCQKINAKMGGENNSLVFSEVPDILRRPVIVIGADVNHPGPSTGVKPSLVACVASLNARLSRYAVSIRAQANVNAQKKAVEIIQDLKAMVAELLRAFYRHTRKKPEKIIFLRDGVSEGQFEEVREHEIRCIREACRSLQEDYEPGITFIVVQKRHHTRFMPADDRDGVGKMKNIPPGTTVDTTVCHPHNFDFFLCSHFGLKGTSRPSHYTVLEDDNDFKADDLQKLTYQLCHPYARCTKSISIPVPVAYADLAAYRARQHLEAALEESTTSSDSSGSSDGYQPLSNSVIDAIKVIDGLRNAMYFV